MGRWSASHFVPQEKFIDKSGELGQVQGFAALLFWRFDVRIYM